MSGTGQEKRGGGTDLSTDGIGKSIVPSEVYSGWNRRRQGLSQCRCQGGMDDALAGTGQEKDQMVPSLFRDRTEPDASHSPRRMTGRRQGVREMVETDTQHGRRAEREIILVLTDYFSRACHLNGSQVTEVIKTVEK